jgi:predicted lipoprotein with Yx(FWY)xxD motif
MPRSPRIDRRRTRRGSWPRASVLIVASLSGVALAALAGMALAKTRTTLGSARNAALGKTILVDGRGLTVYELSPETTHHLLCTKAAGCFPFWPPVTVKSSKTKLSLPAGVKGKLTTLHRNGFFQLVLAGHPLYRFAPDGTDKRRAFGDGLQHQEDDHHHHHHLDDDHHLDESLRILTLGRRAKRLGRPSYTS